MVAYPATACAAEIKTVHRRTSPSRLRPAAICGDTSVADHRDCRGAARRSFHACSLERVLRTGDQDITVRATPTHAAGVVTILLHGSFGRCGCRAPRARRSELA